ncbi:hypothetical protein BGZ95_010115 [Linnemannia exigua]|uniref:RING-type E3 ubiquitin transferase n=1 Tax=Linnemannia exigua TaxID=604196 RepID=A0AAD4H683_9FUNG|nr:hypothetical protein BGZ95_010115 [Linnemannia exigua]
MDSQHTATGATTTTSSAGAGVASVLRNRHHPNTPSNTSSHPTLPSTQAELEDETLRVAVASATEEDRPHGSSTAELVSSSSTLKDNHTSSEWSSLQENADSESRNTATLTTDSSTEATGATISATTIEPRQEGEASVIADTGSRETISTAATTATALPTPTPTPTTKPIDAGFAAGSDSESNGEFSCNICFDTSMSPVLTLCGHLFCWACLHQWLEAQHQNPTCPVCKAGCAQDKVIPIYGRGKEQLDPRSTTPKRPAGQRPEPFRNPNQTGFALGTGQVTFSGTMLPPFMFTPFGIQYGATYSGTIGGNGAVQTPMQAYVSRMFFMLGTLILVGILLY